MLDGNDKEVGTIETTVTAQKRQEVTEGTTTVSPDKDDVTNVLQAEDESEDEVDATFPKNQSLSQIFSPVVVPPKKRGQDLGLPCTQLVNSQGEERYSMPDKTTTGEFPEGFVRYLILQPKYINGVPAKDGSSFRASSRGGGKDLENQMHAKNGSLATHKAFDDLSLLRKDIDSYLIIPALKQYKLPLGREFYNLGTPGKNFRYPYVVMDTLLGYDEDEEPIISSVPVPFATHILEKVSPKKFVVRIVYCDVCIFDFLILFLLNCSMIVCFGIMLARSMGNLKASELEL
jgi:hypothetical protein